ncbi:MAG: tetratricopeptide repeat protein [Phycisphaerae bacterium]
MIRRISSPRTLAVVTLIAALAAPGLLAADQDTEAQEFQTLQQKVLAAGAEAETGDIARLLKQAEQMGKNYAANVAIKAYFARRIDPPLEILLAAGDTAYLAGDYRSAVARYKAFLTRHEKSDADAANAAARLTHILIDYLQTEQNAFAVLAEYGPNLRSFADVRRFDGWFFSVARRQRAVPEAARMLEAVWRQKLDKPQRDYFYRDDLNWLLDELRTPGPGLYAALPAVRSLTRLTSDDKALAARIDLLAENLEFHARSAGKDAKALEKDFAPVIAAAEAWLKLEPTGQTLKAILDLWDNLEGKNSDDVWRIAEQAKRKWTAQAFGKLKDDQQRLIWLDWASGWNWPNRVMSGRDWALAAIGHSQPFSRLHEVWRIPFDLESLDRKQLSSLAKALEGLRTNVWPVAAAAVSSDDFEKCLAHLARNGMHIQGRGEHNLRRPVEQLWEIYKSLQAGDEAKTSGDVFHKAMFRVGTDMLADTAVFEMDWRLAEKYMDSANRTGDRQDFLTALKALAWNTWETRQREEIFRDARRDWQDWVKHKRRELREDKNRDKLEPEVLKLIEQVEDELKIVADRNYRGDTAKAPNEFCKNLVLAENALSKGQADQFAQAAGKLYQAVKDFENKKTPGGWATMERILGDYRLDTSDLQAEILVDFFQRWQPGQVNTYCRSVAYEVCERPRNMGFFNSGDDYQKRMLKFAESFRQINMRLIDKGQFDKRLFDYYRGSRRGNRWSRNDFGTDVLAAIIEKQLFEKNNVQLADDLQTAATSYMYLLRHEFTPLASKYPPGKHFDDLFIRESRQRKFVDPAYWRFGLNEKKRVSDAAAEILAAYKLVPYRYQNSSDSYSREDFEDLQSRILATGTKAALALEKKVVDEYFKTRFSPSATGREYFERVERGAAKGDAQWWSRLEAVARRLAERPHRNSLPDFRGLYELSAAELTNEQTDALLKFVTTARPGWWPRDYTRELSDLLKDSLLAQGRINELALAMPELWKRCGDTGDGDYKIRLARWVSQLAEQGYVDLAVAISQSALEMSSSRLTQEARHTLMAIRAKGGAGMVIPVARSDPRYGIYSAQASYLSGQFKTAWEQYLRNERILLDEQFNVYKDLDPEFTFWLIGKNTEQRRYDQAEQIARTMMVWFDSIPSGLDAQLRAELLLSYANLSFAQEEFPKARAQFKRVADAEEFTGTAAQTQAKIRVAEVDRVTGQYGQAIEELTKLSHRNDRQIQAIAYYNLALVRYDQEQFAEARDFLDKVFTRQPGHPQARVLEGRINLKLGKLEEPTELHVGPIALRKFIVPGSPLKVTLEDQNLARVGKATDIEIRAWTDSGDEEFFSLVPFGDSKTKFRGAISTELAAARKDDNVLQVLGGDQVHYSFSEAFKQRQNVKDAQVYSLTVRTDGQLLISSGEILSQAQREKRALEERIRREAGLKDPEKQQVALSTIRQDNQIKPGNQIYVRVTDLDRSLTAERDKLAIQVRTSSGDIIERLEITETDTHSGVFEGSVATASGQALAYASDSAEGREANFVISSEEYPAWVGMPVTGENRAKTFSVDMNDNVAPEKMKIVAGVPGRRLTRFILQSSLNGKDYRPLATYPSSVEPWDGQLQKQIVRYVGRGAPKRIGDVREYMEQTYFVANKPMGTQPAKTIGGKWDWQLGFDEKTRKAVDLGKYGNDEYWMIRYRVAFYQDDARERTFKLKTKESEKTAYFLSVDGQVGRESPTELTTVLHRGVHVLEVYIFTDKNAGPQFELLGDIPDPPYMAPLEEAFYSGGPRQQIAEFIRKQKTPARIVANADGTEFTVEFDDATNSRVVRLLLADYISDAPAINKITLVDRQGKTILPTKEDFRQLRKNQVLEIVPGDRVRVSYADPTFLSPENELHEAFLTATYNNGRIAATFLEVYDAGGYMQERYVPMRRFKPGDTIAVQIFDPDGDVSEKADTLEFTVKTAMGEPVKMTALETQPHSGLFVGRLFPVKDAPSEPNEIQVRPGDTIQMGYMDRENTDPGVPYVRTVSVEQSRYVQPELRVFQVSSQPLEAEQIQAGWEEIHQAAEETFEELVLPRRNLQAIWPEQPDVQTTQIVAGGPLLVEVLHPAQARSVESTVELFVQTSTGRKMFAESGGQIHGPFDINVPGTIRLKTRAGSAGAGGELPAGYNEILVRGDAYAADPMTDGRFTFSVPMEFGPTPATSLAAQQVQTGATSDKPVALQIHADDEIFIGFKYVDEDAPDKPVKWITRKVTLTGDAFMDVLDRRFQLPVRGLFVGEKMYLRVIDPMANLTNEKDRITVEVTTRSGTRRKYELLETFSNSGVFKGLARVVYKSESPGEQLEPDALPAVYGDQIELSYAPGSAEEARSWTVDIFKGADGTLIPFTKRFKDKGIASQTQFHLAEAYFELAKRHRALAIESEQEENPEEAAQLRELAKGEILQGKKLLEEAIRDFPDTQARAQAEYLLGNLALEFAEEAVNPESQRKFYLEAISRFNDIVASYPESPYAPKSQYKKALVYEKMERMNEAFAEYVKLSYRYPDNDLVAETIARLGQYFLSRGKEFRFQADKATDPVEAVQLRDRALKMYKTAAEVFGRMAKRFPRHDLAGKTQVLSAQCYMQAEEYVEAAKVFDEVVAGKNDLPNELVAEAMYWAGENYMRMAEAEIERRDASPPLVEAYRMFKKLTWEYPSGKWAKFARGRLTDASLQKVATQVDG